MRDAGDQTGGQVLVRALEAQGVDRLFCVPGESYLAVLDALHDSPIDVVVARHEGGAAMMAEADGKLTGRPGIAFVTRGPGATNAASGVHVAMQDSTPMVLFVGQIARGTRGREAFQEVDYRQMYGRLAKWVEEIEEPDRIPEILNHAWHVAMSGRPGPVVLTLPEDMLTSVTEASAGPLVEVAEPAPTPTAMARFAEMLAEAEAPIVIAGGSRWDGAAVEALRFWAEAAGLPVACTFRRQHLFDNTHPNYAGDVGLGINPRLRARIEAADLIVLLGARFSENPSQGFTLLDIPAPRQRLVHVHPGAEELGRIYTPYLAISATPGAFLAAARDLSEQTRSLDPSVSSDYRAWSAVEAAPGALTMSHVMQALAESLPDDAILTNGAGNYAIWLHRFWRYRGFGTQVAPTSGSMGYGLPAAIAAKCRHPDRPVICLAGDGCFQMTGQELATARQRGAAVVVLVADNGMYGTIRMHQERHYPHRISATELSNPDFAALAQAHGALGLTVGSPAEVRPALERALASEVPALLHLKLDPEVITPSATIASLRSG
ncbi:MAG: thiamine pyrophosphate-binding protein [Pseudomonadota bacterium]